MDSKNESKSFMMVIGILGDWVEKEVAWGGGANHGRRLVQTQSNWFLHKLDQGAPGLVL